MITSSNALPLLTSACSGADCSDSHSSGSGADVSNSPSFESALAQAQDKNIVLSDRSTHRKPATSKATEKSAERDSSNCLNVSSSQDETSHSDTAVLPSDPLLTQENRESKSQPNASPKSEASGDPATTIFAASSLASITLALVHLVRQQIAADTPTQATGASSSVAATQPLETGTTAETATPVLPCATDLAAVLALAVNKTNPPLNSPGVPTDSRVGQSLTPGVGIASSSSLTAGPQTVRDLIVAASVPGDSASTSSNLAVVILPAPSQESPALAAQTPVEATAGQTSLQSAATKIGEETIFISSQSELSNSDSAPSAQQAAPVRPTTAQTRDHIERLFLVGETPADTTEADRTGSPYSTAHEVLPHPSTEPAKRTVESQAGPNFSVSAAQNLQAANGNSGEAQAAAFPGTEYIAPTINALAVGQVQVGQPLQAVLKDSPDSALNVGPSVSAPQVLSSLSAVRISQAAPDQSADDNDENPAQNESEQDAPSSDRSVSTPAPGNLIDAGGKTVEIASVAGANPALPGSTQADRFHIVEQVTRHLETARLSSGNAEMTLRLRPDHLGSLHLTITTHANGVAARIVVETTQAQQAIESAKEQLRGTLSDKGLNLHSFHVSVEQGQISNGNSGFPGQQETAQERAERSSQRFSGRMDASRRAQEIPLISASEGSLLSRAESSTRLDYRA